MATYDVSATEFFLRDVEHVGQLVPVDDIGFDEDGARLGGVVVDEFLGFGAEG